MTKTEIDELIKRAAVKAALETDGEPEPGLTNEISWPVNATINRGLEGEISNTTKIGYVNGAKGWLIYRGFNCFDLAEKSSFEETTYLLLYGRLPLRAELQGFNDKLIAYRTLPDAVLDVLKAMPKTSHPMSLLATAVSVLGSLDDEADDVSVENETEIAIKLTARMASIAGAISRLRRNKEPLNPDPDLTHAANFLYMMTGAKPGEASERIMDASLILHADHGMNASTFTTMVVNSSLSDMYSSVVAGIGSLKGPLHGGANEAVLNILEEIGSRENVKSWFAKARSEKRKVMGFGHRVYKAYDPRARVLKPIAEFMAKTCSENQNLYDIASALEKEVIEVLGAEKKIFPNVDFYSGIIYNAMGLQTAMFTPIFAVSRISGWTARALEYLEDNRLFRPRAIYTGPIKAEYTPIQAR